MLRVSLASGHARLDTAAIFSPSPPPKEERGGVGTGQGHG